VTAGSQFLVDLYQRLRNAWSVETGRHWQPGNPAAGQCGVTALVVHDELGGEILKTDVNGAWHFYNRIDDKRIDFTMSQFDSPISYDDIPSNRAEALSDCSEQQYELLRARVGGLAGADPAPVVLSPEEREALVRSKAAADGGEFATDQQVRAVWAKHGL
jgi:hypothetical protein